MQPCLRVGVAGSRASSNIHGPSNSLGKRFQYSAYLVKDIGNDLKHFVLLYCVERGGNIHLDEIQPRSDSVIQLLGKCVVYRQMSVDLQKFLLESLKRGEYFVGTEEG